MFAIINHIFVEKGALNMRKYYIDKEVDDSFQAFLVEGAKFTDVEEYPILRSDMVPTTVPEKIMPFSKAITFQGDLSKTVICSFSPDKTFERVRRNPKRYLIFSKGQRGLSDSTFRFIQICR